MRFLFPLVCGLKKRKFYFSYICRRKAKFGGKIILFIIFHFLIYMCNCVKIFMIQGLKRRFYFMSKTIFGPKRDEETGEWRRLRSTELNDLYGKPNIQMGNERGGKRPVGRPKMKWENNVNHDLREVDYTGGDWKTLARLCCSAMNLGVR
ncbi:hypothetical protein C0J52_17464 [Blattella germanica]|nr:hypothetical protein C0J52_17464 [Blattella germanica]